jgi:hypothetical protein
MLEFIKGIAQSTMRELWRVLQKGLQETVFIDDIIEELQVYTEIIKIIKNNKQPKN